MKNYRITFIIGIIGISLFVISSIIGGFLIEGYSIKSQYISETYAIDTEYGIVLRVLGFIPSGILITIFCFRVLNNFQGSGLAKFGFVGLGIFYGMATIVVSIFPCDSGCNKEFIDPSVSQVVHNIAGAFTYLFVPVSIILIGIGLRQLSNYKQLYMLAIAYGGLSILFILLFFSDSTSPYVGLYQRIIETIFAAWIFAVAFAIKNKSISGNTITG